MSKHLHIYVRDERREKEKTEKDTERVRERIVYSFLDAVLKKTDMSAATRDLVLHAVNNSLLFEVSIDLFH